MKNQILPLAFLTLSSCGMAPPPGIVHNVHPVRPIHEVRSSLTGADLTASYWRGVRDQAWAEHKGRPIYHVAVIDGREILYAPIEQGPEPLEITEASADRAAQEALDAAEKPLTRKR